MGSLKLDSPFLLAVVLHGPIAFAQAETPPRVRSAVPQPPPPPQELFWPVANGGHEVLNSFQNPLSFQGYGSVYHSYFHEGVDVRAFNEFVVAMRSGVVRNKADVAIFFDGTLLVEVETPNGVEADQYIHVVLGPWQVGDHVQAGDVIGSVGDPPLLRLAQSRAHQPLPGSLPAVPALERIEHVQRSVDLASVRLPMHRQPVLAQIDFARGECHIADPHLCDVGALGRQRQRRHYAETNNGQQPRKAGAGTHQHVLKAHDREMGRVVCG